MRPTLRAFSFDDSPGPVDCATDSTRSDPMRAGRGSTVPARGGANIHGICHAPWGPALGDLGAHGLWTTAISQVRDSLGGKKATPAGSRPLATRASPWDNDNGDARAPEGRRKVATNLPLSHRFCRPSGALGLWCDASHWLTPVATLLRPYRGGQICPSHLPRVSSRAAGTSPVATFPRPFGAGISSRLHCHGRPFHRRPENSFTHRTGSMYTLRMCTPGSRSR